MVLGTTGLVKVVTCAKHLSQGQNYKLNKLPQIRLKICCVKLTESYTKLVYWSFKGMNANHLAFIYGICIWTYGSTEVQQLENLH